MSENNIGDPELINQLNDLMAKLPKGIHLMSQYGAALADADSEYRKAKAIRTARLKDAGTPVTLIKDLIYEDDDLDYLLRKEGGKC